MAVDVIGPMGMGPEGFPSEDLDQTSTEVPVGFQGRPWPFPAYPCSCGRPPGFSRRIAATAILVLETTFARVPLGFSPCCDFRLGLLDDHIVHHLSRSSNGCPDDIMSRGHGGAGGSASPRAGKPCPGVLYRARRWVWPVGLITIPLQSRYLLEYAYMGVGIDDSRRTYLP